MKEATEVMRDLWPWVVGAELGAFIGWVIGYRMGRTDALSEKQGEEK